MKGAFTPEVLAAMAPKPVVFALANPESEIDYQQARALRPDAVVATGRSDTPNQVNNVLGFPYIFRGALDVRATAINDEMKIAAVMALAELAREDVPDSVVRAYGGRPIRFGPEYIIPKPLDSRVLLRVVCRPWPPRRSNPAWPACLCPAKRLREPLGDPAGARARDPAQDHHPRPAGPPADRAARGQPPRSFCGPRTMPPGKISPARSCWAMKPKSENWRTNCSCP